jgi:MFS family permease
MTKESKEVLRKLSISYFFVHMGLLLGTWTGRIPDVKNTRQLSDAMFGLILICAILGGILSLMMTGVLAKRLGSSTTLFVGALVSVTLSPIVGITKGGLFVCILGMICIGFGLGTIDVCMYSQAVLYEKKKGTPHLGMFSATTALGTFLGAMMAGFASEAGVSPFMNFVFITFGSTPIIVLCYFNLIHKKEEDHINKIYTQQNEAMRKESVEEGSYEPEQQHACLSTFGAYCLSAKFQMGLLWMISYLSAMGDGSMSDWSTVYFVSTLGQSTRVAALSYSVYSLMMGLGRISTDYLVHALGSANVVRVSGVIAAGGLFMLVLAPYIERLFHMGLPFAVGGKSELRRN